MKNKAIISVGAVLVSFFIQGFCDIVGISSEYAREAFGWSHTTAGFLPSMVFVWFLFFSVPVGIKMNSWGRKNTVLVGMGVTVVGMFIPLLQSSWACLAGYAMLGIGNAILQVSQNSLLKNIIADDKKLTSAVTAGQVVKALSSFSGPFIILFAINFLGGGDTANWYLVFPVLGAITLLSALWLFLSPIRREEPQPSNVTLSATFSLLRDNTILILFFGIFFAVAIDVGTNFVSSKLMTMRYGWDIADAGVAPQIYFICRTVGAFLGVFLMTKISATTYFRWNIIACIVVLASLALVRFSAAGTLALIGAVGFLCSCIFPIIFSKAVQAKPNKANLISGLLITAVAGGGAATPLIGWATDIFNSISAGICVLILCALYLCYCSRR
ncbi:MAG: MFS transporter [Prevotella sp.]